MINSTSRHLAFTPPTETAQLPIAAEDNMTDDMLTSSCGRAHGSHEYVMNKDNEHYNDGDDGEYNHDKDERHNDHGEDEDHPDEEKDDDVEVEVDRRNYSTHPLM